MSADPSPFLLAIQAFTDVTLSDLPLPPEPGVRSSLSTLIVRYLRREVTFSELSTTASSLLGIPTPVDSLWALIECDTEPIPFAEPRRQFAADRRFTRGWDTYEYQRLLVGILRYGIKGWTAIEIRRKRKKPQPVQPEMVQGPQSDDF